MTLARHLATREVRVPKPLPPDRSTLYRIAADADLDHRTVKSAFARGLKAVRADSDRRRLCEAAKKHGYRLE